MPKVTVEVGGDEITIEVKARYYWGNFIGYHVWFNGEKRFVNTLYVEDAVKFVVERGTENA